MIELGRPQVEGDVLVVGDPERRPAAIENALQATRWFRR